PPRGAPPGGGMHRAITPSAYLPSPDYYKRLDHLQQGLRDSEKKRLELERKLYECNPSDICRVKPKYGELKKYLKEICESEKRARTRNQEYLKRFEQIQAHLGHFTTKAELKLQELKVTSCFLLFFCPFLLKLEIVMRKFQIHSNHECSPVHL
uniref:Centrosomal protein kizuna n=1 Tax=Sus scrofa TaxID=9823 RepID=A0A8D1UKX4_PIG